MWSYSFFQKLYKPIVVAIKCSRRPVWATFSDIFDFYHFFAVFGLIYHPFCGQMACSSGSNVNRHKFKILTLLNIPIFFTPSLFSTICFALNQFLQLI